MTSQTSSRRSKWESTSWSYSVVQVPSRPRSLRIHFAKFLVMVVPAGTRLVPPCRLTVGKPRLLLLTVTNKRVMPQARSVRPSPKGQIRSGQSMTPSMVTPCEIVVAFGSKYSSMSSGILKRTRVLGPRTRSGQKSAKEGPYQKTTSSGGYVGSSSYAIGSYGHRTPIQRWRMEESGGIWKVQVQIHCYDPQGLALHTARAGAGQAVSHRLETRREVQHPHFAVQRWRQKHCFH